VRGKVQHLETIGRSLCVQPWFSGMTFASETARELPYGRWYAEVSETGTINCEQANIMADQRPVDIVNIFPFAPTYWEQQQQFSQSGVWQDPVW
jgi:hypothetical protein